MNEDIEENDDFEAYKQKQFGGEEAEDFDDENFDGDRGHNEPRDYDSENEGDSYGDE